MKLICNIFFRGKVAQDHKEKSTLLDKSKQDENKDMLAFRLALSVQKKAKKNQDEMDRRQSLFTRGEHAQVQKGVGALMNKYVFYFLLFVCRFFVDINLTVLILVFSS